MKKNIRIEEVIEIHYCLEDNSHKMNAYIRNKAEKELLDSMNRLGSLYDIELLLETEAYEEGGLKEKIIASFGATLLYLQPAINDTFTYYMTKDYELEELQKNKIKEEVKSQQLDNQKKEIENKILEDRLTQRYISNFYKKVDGYNKIEKIGFKKITKNTNEKEYIVYKKDFNKFILIDEIDLIEDDNANIEIISPILKEGKYRWKGLYNGDAIQFSMGDSNYKEKVINGKETFASGSLINCNLQIRITYDEFGDEKRKSFSVKEVYGKIENSFDELKYTNAGIKKKKRQWEDEHQTTMFDFYDDN